MRDYKNIKVPGSLRGSPKRTTVKRVDAGRGPGQSRKKSSGLKNSALKIVAIVTVVACGWLAWQAYQTLMHAERFQIAGVDIKGSKQVSEAELRELASVFTGQNIFRVDIETPLRRARANPWVKDVRIYRQLPNRISMVFIERTPFALLDAGDARFLLDRDGVIIDRISGESAAAWRLPVVALKDQRIRIGEQVTGEGIAEAFTLIAEIAGRGGWPLHEVTINAESPESLGILYAGREFKIGQGHYPEKLKRLAEISADGQQRGWDIAYVDLRPERQAAAMVKKTEHKVQRAAVKGKIQNNKRQMTNKYQ